ncbi:MAG: FAD-dependent oxidoreductase, partial [Brevinematales bacterium]
MAVVGGGIAGIEAARKLAELHQSPLLVVPSEDALGGKALKQGVLALRFLMEESRLLRERNPSERYRELRQRLVGFWNFWRQSVKEELLRLGVEIVYGRAVFTLPFLFSVGGVAYEAERVILATGSQWELENTGGSSLEMWTEWETLPLSLLVFGEGKEACEVAYLFASLGSEVNLVTSTGGILSGKGERFRQVGESLLKSVGVKIRERHTLFKVEREENVWKASLQDSEGNDITLFGEKVCFLSRRKGTLPFPLEEDVVSRKVPVNERYETKIKGVFAIGDVIHPGCEAQVAKREGILVAENVFLDMVPPLVSSVQLHKDGIDYCLVPEVLFLDYPLVRV